MFVAGNILRSGLLIFEVPQHVLGGIGIETVFASKFRECHRAAAVSKARGTFARCARRIPQGVRLRRRARTAFSLVRQVRARRSRDRAEYFRCATWSRREQVVSSGTTFVHHFFVKLADARAFHSVREKNAVEPAVWYRAAVDHRDAGALLRVK